jgi:hypothetical protein
VKKFISCLISLLLIVSTAPINLISFTASAQSYNQLRSFTPNSEETRVGVKVIVDGVLQKYETNPELTNGVILAPLIRMCDVAGATYTYANNIYTIKNGFDTITVTLNNSTAQKNGSNVTLDTTPIDRSGVTMAPVKSIFEMFGYTVSIDNYNRTATVKTKEKSDWWYQYPTQAEGQYVTATNANTSRNNYGADFAWGPYTQRLSYEETKTEIQSFQSMGKKLISYFESSGTPLVYSVAYKRNTDGSFTSTYPADLTKQLTQCNAPQLNAWGWSDTNLQNLNYITFTGIHSTINDEDIVQPNYTKEALNLTAPSYPDNSTTVGYLNNENPYPLNAKIYDATCAKKLDGVIGVDFDMPYTGQNKTGLMNLTVGSSLLPSYPGANNGDTLYFRNASLKKDPAAPFWKDYNKLSAKQFMKFGVDGAWFDNMSAWDNFMDLKVAFGDWSENGFKAYLQQNFTTAQLQDMGINDISTFNIRQYVIDKAVSMGEQNPLNTDSPIYKDCRWLSDKVWNAYKIYKKNVGSDYLKDLYSSMKTEAALAGKTNGFAVIGNDIMTMNHGWTDDSYVDMCGTELTSQWSLTFGSRGITDPPIGKMAIMYRSLLENQSGPYPVVWFYSNPQTANKTETGKVLLAEAFANNTFIKRADNTVGTDASHLWMNNFANAQQANLSPRYMNCDIGILFSPANQLGNSVPGSIIGNNNDIQYHTQGMWGFSQALVDAHMSYRVIPEWKLNTQTLRGLKTLILPNTECLDDDELSVLTTFVNEGGRLVVTGPAGLRQGNDGYFEKRTTPLLNTLVGRDISNAPGIDLPNNPSTYDMNVYTNTVGNGTVVWCAEPVGYDYYNNISSRSTTMTKVLQMVETSNIFDGSALPITVGSYLWKSSDANTLFVDMVNYDVNIASDYVTPKQNLTFSIKLPYKRVVDKVYAISPDGTTELQASPIAGGAVITLPQLNIYTSVKITTKEDDSSITDGFEGYSPDSSAVTTSLGDWTDVTGGNYRVIDSTSGAPITGTKSIMLTPDSSADVSLSKNLSVTGDQMVAECNVKINSVSSSDRVGMFRFEVNNNGRSYAPFEIMSWQGRAVLRDCETDITDLTPGQVYDIKVVFKKGTADYDIYINGVYRKSSVNKFGTYWGGQTVTNVNSITKLSLVSEKDVSPSSVTVDDVKVYAITDKSIFKDNFDSKTTGTYTAAQSYSVLNDGTAYFDNPFNAYSSNGGFDIIDGSNAINGKSFLFKSDTQLLSSFTDTNNSRLMKFGSNRYAVFSFKFKAVSYNQNYFLPILSANGSANNSFKAFEMYKDSTGLRINIGGTNIYINIGQAYDISCVIDRNTGASSAAVSVYLDGVLKASGLKFSDDAALQSLNYFYFQSWAPDGQTFDGQIALDDISLYIPGNTSQLNLVNSTPVQDVSVIAPVISVNYSNSILASSANTSNFTLYENGVSVPNAIASAVIDPQSNKRCLVTLNSNVILRVQSAYSLSITGAQDIFGNSLNTGGPTSLKFKTGSIPTSVIKYADTFDNHTTGTYTDAQSYNELNNGSGYFAQSGNTYSSNGGFDIVDGTSAIYGKSILFKSTTDHLSSDTNYNTQKLMDFGSNRYAVFDFRLKVISYTQNYFMASLTANGAANNSFRSFEMYKDAMGIRLNTGGVNTYINIGQTYRITCVIDRNNGTSSATVSIYLDGVLKASGVKFSNDAALQSLNYFYFQSWAPDGQTFDGQIALDDISLYVNN